MVKRAFKEATPVARRVAAQRMRDGKSFAEIEDEFINIIGIESPLYDSMKESLVDHIQRHGLNAVALEYFDEFVQVEYFTKHAYQKVLKKVRHAYVDMEHRINDADAKIAKAGDNYLEKNKLEQEKKKLDTSLKNLEYLISKITEYLQKVDDLSSVVYDMIMQGKSPDFEAWRDKMIIQDILFEENKQFLKQSLHHLAVLEQNKCKLGVDDLRLLLYHKQGCRREKLYRKVEEWIIKIYYSLDTEDERRYIYKDICLFIEEVVPMAGYISPMIIHFILDRDFVSEDSRNLLMKIKPVVAHLYMTSLIVTPLRRMYDRAVENLSKESLSESDIYVMEVMKLYNPKIVSDVVNEFLSSRSH
ncbi:MAG: hypothetical protein IJ532_05835 [Alphaproteobacteria bacterium]|nr:hypothetical protein [Alphaproteobacteria bacterium]